jgi:hypothetical protein
MEFVIGLFDGKKEKDIIRYIFDGLDNNEIIKCLIDAEIKEKSDD